MAKKNAGAKPSRKPGEKSAPKNGAGSRPPAKAKAHPSASKPEVMNPRALEIQEFAKAAGLYNAGKYQQAEPLFRKLSEATTIEIAHAARMRLEMCRQRVTAQGS